MARTAKIWFWKARKTWCVYINGKKHLLGEDKKEAKTKFHNLMGQSEAPQPVAQDSVEAVLDDFLTWTQENRSPKTYRGYKDFCQSFVNDYGKLPINRLTTAEVTQWLAAKETWNTTTKRGAVTCLMRAFNWSVKNRGFQRNPIAGMEKHEAKTRTQILTLEEFKKILRNTPDREFRDLLRFSYETGSRPQEAKRLEGRHIELEKSRCVFPADESKKKRTRVIYLNDKALAIVRRRLTDGVLFINKRGRPWTARAVKCRFERLEPDLFIPQRHDSCASWLAIS